MHSQFFLKHILKFKFNIFPKQNTLGTLSFQLSIYEHISVYIKVTGRLFFKSVCLFPSIFSLCAGNLQYILNLLWTWLCLHRDICIPNVITDGTYKNLYYYFIVQIKLMISYNIEVSKCYYSRIQDKYDEELLKRIEIKASFRVLMQFCKKYQKRASELKAEQEAFTFRILSISSSYLSWRWLQKHLEASV